MTPSASLSSARSAAPLSSVTIGGRQPRESRRLCLRAKAEGGSDLDEQWRQFKRSAGIKIPVTERVAEPPRRGSAVQPPRPPPASPALYPLPATLPRWHSFSPLLLDVLFTPVKHHLHAWLLHSCTVPPSTKPALPPLQCELRCQLTSAAVVGLTPPQ